MDRSDREFLNVIVRVFIAILIFCGGLYAGSTISTAHTERYRTESINNAVSEALESTRTPLNCDDNVIIETIKSMAVNGAHVKSYKLFLELSDGEEPWLGE